MRGGAPARDGVVDAAARPINSCMSRAAIAIAAFLGGCSWYVLGAGRAGGEGWDNPQYFMVLLPIVVTASIVAGIAVPRWTPRSIYGFFGGQALVAFVRNPSGGLLPLGLVLFFIIATVCAAVALGASAAWRWIALRAGRLFG